MSKIKKALVLVGIAVSLLAVVIGGSQLGYLVFPLYSAEAVASVQPNSKLIATKDFINMTEEDFASIKEIEIFRMIVDTARANNIKPLIFCGLAYHESSKFKYAHSKIKDSNGKWSYGLFMIQLETALLYDKEATPEKLMTPTYNTHLAAVIYTTNHNTYKTNTFAVAAHNAGSIKKGKITNPEFIKLVETAIGNLVLNYDL